MIALTKREIEVMQLVCEGMTAQTIGERLGISSRTVEIHRRAAVVKLGARNQTHAAVLFDRAEAADRIEALTAEVRRLDYSTTHTCWDECPRLPCAQRREIEALTARAEAAEARNKVLEEALDGVMIGGNHLALLIGADHPAYGTDHYAALEHYGAGDHYEAWCAWDAIMLARQALGGEHA